MNPPEVTINNELKRANAMYIGQQFQVMRTFMSTCEFHAAVTQNEPSGTTEMTAQKAHSRRVLPFYLYLFNFVIFMIHRPTIYYSSLESKWFKEIIYQMLALKLLKKCSENSSKETGKGKSAYAYLHSRMHMAVAAL